MLSPNAKHTGSIPILAKMSYHQNHFFDLQALYFGTSSKYFPTINLTIDILKSRNMHVFKRENM